MSKQIKQFYIPNDNSIPAGNLVKGKRVYSFSIHSLPGNIFYLNGSKIIMNNTGNFSLNVENYPITSIELDSNNNYTVYPTIIDIIYEQVEEIKNE